jgi:hypothetical protein
MVYVLDDDDDDDVQVLLALGLGRVYGSQPASVSIVSDITS